MPRKTTHDLLSRTLVELQQIVAQLELDNNDLEDSLAELESELTNPRSCEPALPSPAQQLQKLTSQDDK